MPIGVDRYPADPADPMKRLEERLRLAELKIEVALTRNPFGPAAAAALAGHVTDTTAAHAASAVSFAPDGSIVATTVQAAIVEVRDEAGGGGGGAPTTTDYLVGTADAGLSAEIVVGTSPGGELGGTWAAPTVDATHSGSTHAAAQAAAEATAAADATAKANAAQAASQPLAAVLTATTASFLTADETKLDGIAAGATANSPDATLLARANHTGVQAIATVTDLQTTLDAKETPAAAQAKVDTHVNDTSAAHAASAISVDSTTLVGVGTTAQAVYEEMDDAIAANLAAIALKAPLASPTFTGDVVVPDANAATEAMNRQASDARYFLLAGLSGGNTLVGGTGSGDDLTLASTVDATRGTIFVRDQVELLSEDKTNTTTTPVLIANIDSAITLADAGGGLNPGNNLFVLRFASTVLYDNDGGILQSANLFANQATIKNRNGETRSIYGFYTFFAQPLFQADGATVTTSGNIALLDAPIFSVLSAGVLNAAGTTTVVSGATVNTGATVTLRRGFVFSDSTGAGTVTTGIGVDIEALADAATSIGIRNASTAVKTPKANANITAVSDTIAHTGAIVSLTANASYTLTSAPTITDGQNGEELLIINVDTADTITIQDQGTLASSNLRLTATTVALGPRDSIRLVYSSTVGDWVQVSPVTNVI